MTPSLSTRGKFILATGLMFVFVGSLNISPALIALGGCVLAALLSAYLWFFPTAILLRRRKVELSWWIPPGEQPGGALSVDRPFSLHVAPRNHSGRPLRLLNLTIIGHSSLELPGNLEALVPGGRQVELVARLRAHSAGYMVLHGAILLFGDILGLFHIRAYFPNPLPIKVFPRQAALGAGAGLRPRHGALHERVGLHQVRQRGLAGELREIREHTHGDPFKYIAWKPTARRQKLMVRELETQIVVTHQILIDISGSMRGGVPGKTKLDYARETAASLARSAVDSGDRVGLISFDTRVYSLLRPAAGHHHYLQLLDRIVELSSIVDEDLTDLTNSELVAAAAQYLAHQEAVDVRLRRAPPLDDSAWDRIQAGPAGELYDLGAMLSVVSSLLGAAGKSPSGKHSTPKWSSRVQVEATSDPQLAEVRRFCRARGIELPYRRNYDAGRRAAGLAHALDTITGPQRADSIIVISDLYGVAENPDVVTRALSRAQRQGQRVRFIAPFAPAFLPTASSTTGEQVTAVLRQDEQQRFENAQRILNRVGIPAVAAGPTDNATLLLRQLAKGGKRRKVA